MDVVNSETRSRMMAGIQGRNTAPELTVRRGLHGRGYRYRLQVRSLPGRPDLVLPKYKAVIFVNGCFWHRHDCSLFKWPTTRADFWKNKLNGNAERDLRKLAECQSLGWRTLTVWECSLKGKSPEAVSLVIDQVEGWLLSERNTGVIG